MSPRLVVFGLGNPGTRYARTRHNLGFRVVDRMAADYGVTRWTETRSYLSGRLELGSTRVDLVKPKTFMNLSGAAVRLWTARRHLPPEELIVVVDDIALPLGQLRLRRRGTDGGHNGLKSVIAAVGTIDFPRLRLGIGPCPPEVDPAEFVLGRFSGEERPVVDAMVDRAVRCVEAVVRQDFDRVMSAFNTVEGEAGKAVDPRPDV
jgi:PTH1 family peptidyl-tRNA hydrolase